MFGFVPSAALSVIEQGSSGQVGTVDPAGSPLYVPCMYIIVIFHVCRVDFPSSKYFPFHYFFHQKLREIITEWKTQQG